MSDQDYGLLAFHFQNGILVQILGTLEYTAEIGSSNKYISASEYRALAKFSLDFWPPDNVIPLLPTKVSSPFSQSNLQFEKITCRYVYKVKNILIITINSIVPKIFIVVRPDTSPVKSINKKHVNPPKSADIFHKYLCKLRQNANLI